GGWGALRADRWHRYRARAPAAQPAAARSGRSARCRRERTPRGGCGLGAARPAAHGWSVPLVLATRNAPADRRAAWRYAARAADGHTLRVGSRQRRAADRKG